MSWRDRLPQGDKPLNNERVPPAVKAEKPPTDYFHLTNMESPIDKVDGNFLNVLEDYRIGAPQPTAVKTRAAMQAEGVFGVYATRETMNKPSVLKLSGFTVKALSQVKL